MGFKTAEDGHVYNDDKKSSSTHHGSVKPGTGMKLKKVIERKSSPRATVVKELLALSPKIWLKDGQEFDGNHEGTIWSGEGAYMKDGDSAFSYWSSPQIHPEVEKILDKNDWFAEWNDGGTIFLYPGNARTAKFTEDDFPTPPTEKLSFDDYQKKMMAEIMDDPEMKSQLDGLLKALKKEGIVPPKK